MIDSSSVTHGAGPVTWTASALDVDSCAAGRSSHRNISDFLARRSPERWHRLRYEDLVEDPVAELEALCNGLGLGCDPAMARPYEVLGVQDGGRCVHESAPIGDPASLPMAASTRHWPRQSAPDAEPAAGDRTVELAARLGYGRSGSVEGRPT